MAMTTQVHVYKDNHPTTVILQKYETPTLSIGGCTIYFNDDTLERTIKALQKMRRKIKKMDKLTGCNCPDNSI